MKRSRLDEVIAEAADAQAGEPDHHDVAEAVLATLDDVDARAVAAMLLPQHVRAVQATRREEARRFASATAALRRGHSRAGKGRIAGPDGASAGDLFMVSWAPWVAVRVADVTRETATEIADRYDDQAEANAEHGRRWRALSAVLKPGQRVADAPLAEVLAALGSPESLELSA